MVIFRCSNRERPYELYIFIASVAIVTSYCVVDFIIGLQEGLDNYPFQIKLVRVGKLSAKFPDHFCESYRTSSASNLI